MSAIIATCISIIYLLTISNSIYGGDAGDLVSAILTKGFAHPPGYPLYTLLGIVVSKIPLNLTSAGKITLVSTFASFLSLILIYHIVQELFEKKFKKYLAIFVVLVLGFNYLIWLYAIVPEVFPLNTLITLSIFYFSVRYYKKGLNRYLYALPFLIGLGISHHHTFIFILPSSLYLVYKRLKRTAVNKKLFLAIFGSLFLGLTPLLYLYTSRLQSPKILWGNPHTLVGFIAIVTRQNYGTFVPGPFITNIASHRFVQLLNLFIFIINDFSVFGLLLIIMGLIGIASKKYLKHEQKLAVILALFLFGPFFVFYANFPIRIEFEFATLERFFIVFYFLLAIPLYLGIYLFLNYIRLVIDKLIKNVNLRHISYRLFLIILLIYPFGLGFKSFKSIIAIKNSRTAENLGTDILQNATPNSLILLASDTVLFDTQYVYYSGNFSKDKKYVIHANKLPTDYYQESLSKNYPEIRLAHPNLISSFIKVNFDHFSIYSNDKYPLNTDEYEWVPQGLLFKLEKKPSINSLANYNNLREFWDKSVNKDLANDFLYNRRKYNNFFNSEILRTYSIAHQNSAYYLLGQNKPQEAYPHIKKSLILQPNDSDNYYLLSKYYSQTKECQEAENSIEKILPKLADRLYLDQLQDIADNCYVNEEERKNIQKLIDQYKKKQKTTLHSF